MGLTYEQVRESFVRHIESLGLVSLDTARHEQLSGCADIFAEGLRKFFAEENPALVALTTKADPVADADDAAKWLDEIELPKGWSFRKIPSTHAGAGTSVFAHYEVKDEVNQVVPGVAHAHLVGPDGTITDIRFRPDEGRDKFGELVSFAILGPQEPAVEGEPNAG